MAPSAHAKLSASGAERWMACPGSVTAEADLPNTSSSFADEGTTAHWAGEFMLRTPDKALPSICPETKLPISDEMVEYVQAYVDYVEAARKDDGDLLIETRLDLTDWIPEGFGTSDAIVIKGQTIEVIDLKYGKGIKVYAEENKQLMLYALGTYALLQDIYEISNVKITICQPRLDHIDSWELSAKELLKFGNLVAERAQAALASNAERNASDKACQWCKAKATCPALKALTDRTVTAYFDDIADTLSDDVLREALANKKLIVAWLNAVEVEVRRRLDSGESFPGYKLVQGRSTRSWMDEDRAVEVLLRCEEIENLYTRKLVTPAQAEKLVGKTKAKKLQDLIAVKYAQPSLVHESDKRPAVNITISDFD